jgi:hypothetical protein
MRFGYGGNIVVDQIASHCFASRSEIHNNKSWIICDDEFEVVVVVVMMMVISGPIYMNGMVSIDQVQTSCRNLMSYLLLAISRHQSATRMVR